MTEEDDKTEFFEALSRLENVIDEYKDLTIVAVSVDDLSLVLCELSHLLCRVNKLDIDW